MVITGFGAITPIGLTVDDTWENLISGKSGIGSITLFDASNFDVKIAAEVKNFNPLDYLDPTTTKYTDRFTQFAVASTTQAIESSRLKVDKNYEIGLIIGTGVGGIKTLSKQLENLNKRGSKYVSPYSIPMFIADSAPGQVSILTGIRGLNISLVSSCSTSSDAIGIAYELIKSGKHKVIIAGGAEAAITPIGVAGFSQARALSRTGMRPFDLNRDGFVMGEGGAVIVLESLEYARGRGADILAEITGYGVSSDAYHITAPSPDGKPAARAIEMALDESDIRIDEVGYISAHGTSTKLNDLAETKAIKDVFKEKAFDIPLSSVKSMVGHLLGAAGALEAITCIKAIETGVIPPTINYKTPDPDCDLDYVPNEARRKKVDIALSNSFGFGGHNSILVFKSSLT